MAKLLPYTEEAINALLPLSHEEADELLEYLSIIKEKEGCVTAVVRIKTLRACLKAGDPLPDPESYNVRKLEATSQEDLMAKYMLLLAIITVTYDMGQVRSDETAILAQEIIKPCVNAIKQANAGNLDFPLTLTFDL